MLVTEAEDKVDGRTNAAVGIARAFYFINNDDSSDAAFTFLTKVQFTSTKFLIFHISCFFERSIVALFDTTFLQTN